MLNPAQGAWRSRVAIVVPSVPAPITATCRWLRPRRRSARSASRTVSRSRAVAAKPPSSHALTQTREKPSPVLVAKIVPPANAASSIHATASRRSSSVSPAPRCAS